MANEPHDSGGCESNGQPTCPECDGRIEHGTHERVCTDCGLVLASGAIDHGPEWRAFERAERKRTGAPRTVARHDKGLHTEIGTDAPDGASRARRRQLGRLRHQHARSKFASKRERNRAYAFTEIRRMVAALELGTSLRDQACAVFGRAQDADLVRGRSLEAIASASVYAACRCAGQPRTVADVARVARVEADRIRNAYAACNVALELPTPPRPPRAFVPRLASACDVDPLVRRRAIALAEQAIECGFGCGRNPAGLAAACLEIAAHEHGADLAQAALAEQADVAPVTVRSNRDGLLDRMDGDRVA